MGQQIFIRFSEEASDFIQKLPTKAKIKVLYTIDRTREGYSIAKAERYKQTYFTTKQGEGYGNIKTNRL